MHTEKLFLTEQERAAQPFDPGFLKYRVASDRSICGCKVSSPILLEPDQLPPGNGQVEYLIDLETGLAFIQKTGEPFGPLPARPLYYLSVS